MKALQIIIPLYGNSNEELAAASPEDLDEEGTRDWDTLQHLVMKQIEQLGALLNVERGGGAIGSIWSGSMTMRTVDIDTDWCVVQVPPKRKARKPGEGKG